jgi:hypothetical protein
MTADARGSGAEGMAQFLNSYLLITAAGVSLLLLPG